MTISPEAIQALKQQISSEELHHKAIRFYGQAGCCGPAVQMALVDQLPAQDEHFQIEGVRFAIEPAIRPQLEGVRLAVGPQGFVLEGFQSSSCC